MASSKLIVIPIAERLDDVGLSSLEDMLSLAIDDSIAVRGKISSTFSSSPWISNFDML